MYKRQGDDGSSIDGLAYAPSGELAKHLRLLEKGDRVEVAGGVKPKEEGLTMNIERVVVIETRPRVARLNPPCPRCGGGMESLGKGQGYTCKRCRIHLKGFKPPILSRNRYLFPRIMLPVHRSARHLTKPLKRYGRENLREEMGITFHPWTSLLEDDRRMSEPRPP